MRITSTVLLTILALSACLTAQADEDAPPQETIAVPSSYPPNWLEKQLTMELAGGATMHQSDDGTITIGTITIKNAAPAIYITGELLNPTVVASFAVPGPRSVMLRSEKDSQVYKTLADNAMLKHGDARMPRFDVVGRLRYCAPVTKDQTDWLNPVAVLEVRSVHFYLVQPGHLRSIHPTLAN